MNRRKRRGRALREAIGRALTPAEANAILCRPGNLAAEVFVATGNAFDPVACYVPRGWDPSSSARTRWRRKPW